MSSRATLWLLLSVSLGVNAVFIYGTIAQKGGVPRGGDELGRYEFLSQRIFVERPNDVLVGLVPLRDAVRKYIGENGGEKTSFYFEYLPSATSIGVNDRVEYPLASLFKLPVAIATVARIEKGEESGDRELVLTEDIVDKSFWELWKKGVGARISVREAITASLTQSDNTAHYLLAKNLPQGALSRIYDDFDIPVAQTSLGPSPLGSAKGFSSIFRGMYLASILSKDGSEAILKMLTQTNFLDMLPAGVNGEVKVAHKIGVYEAEELGGTVYSDCGIVYVPKRPYILCMMIRGSESEARERMSYLSKMVYGYVK